VTVDLLKFSPTKKFVVVGVLSNNLEITILVVVGVLSNNL
jgi:hypothetical protein